MLTAEENRKIDRHSRHFDIDLRDFSDTHVHEVAGLHTACFPEKLESILGLACIADLLRSRYLGPGRDSFCRVAILKSDRRLAAYLCGVPLGAREDWPYKFLNRATLRRHLPRRIWTSPRLWRFLIVRAWRQCVGAAADESDALESTARTEVVNIVAVHPECRGGNVGADLMRDYEAQARGRGTCRLRLLVERGNLRAERLYASLGWRRTCPDPDRYSVFAMIKELDPPGGNAAK